MQRAFTLPEVLVAILVLAVGILGLASSGTFIAIQAGEARAVTEAALLAGRVVDSLRAIPCATVASGTITTPRATVRWTASPATRTVAVHATLEVPGRRGIRQWPLDALLPCER